MYKIHTKSAIFTSLISVGLFLGNAIAPSPVLALSTANATYYVALNGNDANPGTLTQPLATWQRAIDQAQPGDTIYLRGGLYRLQGSQGVSILNSGTPTSPIKLWAYPNETPILDAAGLTAPGQLYGIYLNADWWDLKGLEIRNVPLNDGSSLVYGLYCEACNHNRFERLNIHHNQGTGLMPIKSKE